MRLKVCCSEFEWDQSSLVGEAENHQKSEKLNYFMFVRRLCGYSNCSELNPDHEYIIIFSSGCRTSYKIIVKHKSFFFFVIRGVVGTPAVRYNPESKSVTNFDRRITALLSFVTRGNPRARFLAKPAPAWPAVSYPSSLTIWP